jgi:predicted transcriptional regulator YheO
MSPAENELNQAILNSYFPIATFIAKAIGGNAEVVIHDLSKLENSIIFIENGHLSRRSVGDGSTDFVLKTLRDNRHSTVAFIANYRAKAINSNQFKSSTYFIKNGAGKLIGLMCININITHLSLASEWLEDFLSHDDALTTPAEAEPQKASTGANYQEHLQGNIEATLESIIFNAINRTKIEPSRLNATEKKAIVKRLHDEGIFVMKGGVGLTAHLLELSVPTVYRYLKQIKI